MRRLFIAGNWKMNRTAAEAAELAAGLRRELDDITGLDLAVAPTMVALSAVANVLAGSPIAVSGQNLHWQDSGAFTGEVSGAMLRHVGCRHVIIGHSERRQYFGETDETVNLKIKAALNHRLAPIFCIGETLQEREDGKTMERVEIQLRGGVAQLSGADMTTLVIAYEPIWAIGTGRTASSEQAQEVHAFIRSILTSRFDGDVAEATRIQYGGSVKAGNVAELMAQPDIDGALVGGASLSVESFASLVKNAILFRG